MHQGIIALMSIVVLSYYGIQVCPFIASLDTSILLLQMSVGAAAALCIRNALQFLNQAYLASRDIIITVSAWFITSLILTAVNMALYEFPAASGFKLITAFLCVGFFSGSYSALETQHHDIQQLIKQPGTQAIRQPRHYMSIINRFLMFIIVSMGLLAGLLLLLFRNEFVYLANDGKTLNEVYTAATRHILFILAIVISGTIVLSLKYARNLRLIIQTELAGMQRILKGDYRARVPILSDDEFSLFASAANEIVETMEFHQKNADTMYNRSITDKLTGLHNRHYLDEQLVNLSNDYPAHAPISLLIIDIDHFKQVNDRYGHGIGDEALQHIADLLYHALPEHALLIRYGGEEFYVLLPDTATGEALSVAEHLRELVASTPLVLKPGPLSMTISIGIASQYCQQFSIDKLSDQADKALYLAKHSGRNQCQLEGAALN